MFLLKKGRRGWDKNISKIKSLLYSGIYVLEIKSIEVRICSIYIFYMIYFYVVYVVIYLVFLG